MIDLDELQALCEAATPGPWDLPISASFNWGDEKEYYCMGPFVNNSNQARADANFIAAAREGMPELIAENRKLRENLARALITSAIFAEDENFRAVMEELTNGIPKEDPKRRDDK